VIYTLRRLHGDEAFLASTSPTILPVQSINGVRAMMDVPGPVTKRLIQAWSDMVMSTLSRKL
jgi:branched-subunit amino acid aminotransferase/4-amino-4-deoxychorismate lyase